MVTIGPHLPFLTGKPFFITQPDTGRRVPVVWVGPDTIGSGLVARWEIGGVAQRMQKYAAIPKDVKVWEDIILQFCQTIEVLDKTEGMVYTISVKDFNQNKWLLTTKAGPQWAVDRKHWRGREYYDDDA